MRQLNEQERALCSFQARLFEESAIFSTTSSAVFVRRFMLSDYARCIDQGLGVFDAITIQQAIKAIEQEYGDSGYGMRVFDPLELHWMGYVYRYFCLSQGMTSKEVYSLIGARELHSLYYPYHTLDASQVVERVCEAKGIQPFTSIEKGVEALRRIRSEAK